MIMKVAEFVQKLNEVDNVDLQKILEIRTYIPIAEKRAILETILHKCFTVEDGVLICDYILRTIAFELAMIKYHTNLDIDIESEDDYDDIYMYIRDFCQCYVVDYEECQSLFKGMERELRAQYSIEASVASLTNQLSGNIESLVSAITKKINDFDMNKLGLDGIEPSQLKNLLNKYGK